MFHKERSRSICMKSECLCGLGVYMNKLYIFTVAIYLTSNMLTFVVPQLVLICHIVLIPHSKKKTKINKFLYYFYRREFGLERFVPVSLMESMKRKELRRLIGHFLKLNQQMTGSSKMLTQLQVSQMVK